MKIKHVNNKINNLFSDQHTICPFLIISYKLNNILLIPYVYIDINIIHIACEIIMFNLFNACCVSVVGIKWRNQKHNSTLVQNKSSLVCHYSAYVILNRRVRNINIEINLPNESIAGDNCIAETSHRADSFYIQLKPITHTEAFASSWRLPSAVRAVGIFYCFWRAPPK